MEKISGFIALRVTKIDGMERVVSVLGSEFSLEEGGEWNRDQDDGDLYAHFLFIAFSEGFDIILNVNIHGGNITSYDIDIRKSDFSEFEIEKVEIVNDKLDVNDLFPCLDGNDL